MNMYIHWYRLSQYDIHVQTCCILDDGLAVMHAHVMYNECCYTTLYHGDRGVIVLNLFRQCRLQFYMYISGAWILHVNLNGVHTHHRCTVLLNRTLLY